MELFFNYSYFDFAIYGVENASYFFYNKSSSELTIAESAALSAQVITPHFTNPINAAKICKEEQKRVLTRLEMEGKLPPGEAEKAVELFWKKFDRSIYFIERE